MTPLPSVDADAFKLLVILVAGFGLSLDPSPLWTWPFHWWIVLGMAAAWIYQELRGPVDDDLDAPTGDELEDF